MAATFAEFTDVQLQRMRADDFVRWCACLYATDNSPYQAADRFEQLYPRSLHVEAIQKTADAMMRKTAVDPGTSTSVGWSSITPIEPLATAFVQLSRPASLIGKLDARVRKVPFSTSVPIETAGSVYNWVGQASAKPVGSMQFQSTTLPILGAAGLLITTQELMRLTTPASVAMLRQDLIAGLSYFLDQQLLDPTLAGVTNISPPSLTNTAPSYGSSGSSGANALTDFTKGLEIFTASNPDTMSMVVITSPSQAVALAVAANAQTLGPNGGTLFGIDVFTSTAAGSRLVFLDPQSVLLADDSGIEISAARHASVEMTTTATSPATASVVLVSLWASNLGGLKVRRFINWRMARATACLYTVTSWV